MCGLFGVLSRNSPIGKAEKDVLETLAFLSYLRGRDATGIVAIDVFGSVDTHKATVSPADFWSMGKTKDIINKHTTRAILGHTRAGTVGGNILSNAHPFEFDKVVGVHNGTLDFMCRSQYTNKEINYGTDSEGIYSKINDTSIEEVIPQLEGAWALTMWDKVNKKVRFLRNNKRTIYTIASKDNTKLFWASEAEFLDFALQRHTYPYLEDKDGDMDIRLLEPDIHYSLELLNSSAKWQTAELRSDKVYRMSHYSAHTVGNTAKATPLLDITPISNRASVSHTHHNSAANSKSSLISYNPTNKDVISIEQISPKTHEVNGVTELYIETADGSMLTERDFEEVSEKGCACCSKTLKFSEGIYVAQKESAWSDFIGVCASCITHDPFIMPLVEDLVAGTKV